MSARILDGKVLAAQLREDLKIEVSAMRNSTGKSPCLASIIVGEDAGSHSYAQSQQRTAEQMGIVYDLRKLSASVTQAEVLALIGTLNHDANIHGIMVNKPLPTSIDFSALTAAVNPDKDVEGIAAGNLGRLLLGKSALFPCTAAAAMVLLKSSGIDIKGKEAVVLGRSEIVGKPIALLLLREHATVTVCHSRTADLPSVVRRADIVIAAIGQKHFVKGAWLKPGAVVIDVGINDDNGKVTGDVDFASCSAAASFISPVPGGVGPVTALMLMHNVLEAFKIQCLRS